MRFWITITVTLGSVLLVGCVDLQHSGRVAIRAVHPTGETFYVPYPQPIWCFAITNTGNIELHWRSGIETRGDCSTNYSPACGSFDWPWGVLEPGQRITTEMIVPAKIDGVWRAYVESWSVPNYDTKTYKDVWQR
jgi:hypothetical protein